MHPGCTAHLGKVQPIPDEILDTALDAYVGARAMAGKTIWPFGQYWELDFQHGICYEDFNELEELMMALFLVQPSMRFKPAQLRVVLMRILTRRPECGDKHVPHNLMVVRLSRRIMVLAYHVRRVMPLQLEPSPPRGTTSSVWSRFKEVVAMVASSSAISHTSGAEKAVTPSPKDGAKGECIVAKRRKLEAQVSACSSFGPSEESEDSDHDEDVDEWFKQASLNYYYHY